MTEFQRWITPKNQMTTEKTATGSIIEYEEFSTHIDVIGPLLYTLLHDNWEQVQIGHIVQGSVLELEFTEAPHIFTLYDGYLTVVTKGWHIHLCVEDHWGGPHNRTPDDLRERRKISRAAFYRRLNSQGKPKTWGIQFWNGAGEQMMTLFLPNPYLGEDDNILPENKAKIEKLSLYQELRDIYVTGEKPIPFTENPLKRPYLAVCRSSRCNGSQDWELTFNALKEAVAEANLDIPVQTAGCLQVCKMGPVVFNSECRQWFTRVTPEVAKRIVNSIAGEAEDLSKHHYPLKQ
ncbi:MAG: (2Fe-2S) ferredoxin domain-containing protein [Halothece sp.]